MKKLDQLLISSFIPPFMVTFMIAIFVLLMQILWLYIDDIAGKGLGLFILIELLAYKCVSLVPMALPLAMLISSVMVLGNLAEHYELSSFKSAGVPLWRVMAPLMGMGLMVVSLSYLCSNNLIPVANLQFGSRMYDIQQQKPALRLDTGVFNDDFDGYAIHIGGKDDDAHIEDVLIYDHKEASRGRLGQIMAEDGEMYSTDDGSYFVMNLRNGHQYIETKPSGYGKNQNHPFVRTNFRSWTKVFDLSEFQLNRTNKDLFKQNRSMLSTSQLAVAVDSLDLKIRKRERTMSNTVSGYFYFIEADTTSLKMTEEEQQEYDAEKKYYEQMRAQQDSAILKKQAKAKPVKAKSVHVPPKKPKLRKPISAEDKSKMDSIKAKRANEKIGSKMLKKLNRMRNDSAMQANINKVTQVTRNRSKERRSMEQDLDTLASMESIVATFPIYEQAQLFSKAKAFARSIHSQGESAVRSLDRLRESKVKHIYDLHTKYSMAAVCFIFLFIGAPMGAIVRKGGFGYPILISIIFFMLFITLTIFNRKVAETFVLPAAVAAWVPCMVLFPVGLYLTYKAMNDSKLSLFNFDRIRNFFAKLFPKKKESEEQLASQ